MLARERPAVWPIPDIGTVRTITAFFARCAIVGFGGPPRYEEQPLPPLVACSDVILVQVLQRFWDRYFSVAEAPKFCVKVRLLLFATRLAGDTERDSRSPNQGPGTTLA